MGGMPAGWRHGLVLHKGKLFSGYAGIDLALTV
jgi:hypothetical protein